MKCINFKEFFSESKIMISMENFFVKLINLFDFTSFLGLDLLKFSAPLCNDGYLLFYDVLLFTSVVYCLSSQSIYLVIARRGILFTYNEIFKKQVFNFGICHTYTIAYRFLPACAHAPRI